MKVNYPLIAVILSVMSAVAGIVCCFVVKVQVAGIIWGAGSVVAFSGYMVSRKAEKEAQKAMEEALPDGEESSEK